MTSRLPVKRRVRPPGKVVKKDEQTTPPINWEKIAAELKEGLLSEINNNNTLVDEAMAKQKQMAELLEHNRRLLIIVTYLEMKLGLNPV